MKRRKKTKLEYIAVFSKAKEGGYNVSFPDFPGCVTFGKTFEDAEKRANEVLELWIKELEKENEKIPIYKANFIISKVPVAV